MFNSTQLPIKKAVAENFAVFNHLHGAIPSFSEPNHLMWASGTSCSGVSPSEGILMPNPATRVSVGGSGTATLGICLKGWRRRGARVRWELRWKG